MRDSQFSGSVRKAGGWAVGALAGGLVAFGMAALVDVGFTAEWPVAARTAWAAGLLGIGLSAAYAVIRSWRITNGEPDVRDPPLLELPPGIAPANWQQRARIGALLVLALGGWASIGFVISGIRAGEPIRGLMLGTGWCLLLALSGVAGGGVYHLTDPMRRRGWLGRIIANVLSILAYCAATLALLGLVFFVGESL